MVIQLLHFTFRRSFVSLENFPLQNALKLDINHLNILNVPLHNDILKQHERELYFSGFHFFTCK